MTRGYDAIIVGGRVAGAATAMLLARAGARVVVVDRGSYGSDTVSTHAFMRAGVLQLSRWGLVDDVIAARTPPVRHTTFHYADGETLPLTIRPNAGVDALYAPRRHLLDRLLVDAAREAGAEVRHRTTVTELLSDTTGRVTGVRLRDDAGRPAELHAAITVGADGIRSTVAEQAHAEVLRHGSSRSAVLYRYLADLPTTGYEWAYGESVGAGLIPTNDGLTCVFVGTTPERMRLIRMQGASQAFTHLVEQTGGGLSDRIAAAEPVGNLHGWAGAPGYVRQAWGRGWALVGDAGYFKDPSCSQTRFSRASAASAVKPLRWAATNRYGIGFRGGCSTRPRLSRPIRGT
jgi:flavin-dependent dehydrogenase